jgi:hypothetical protein
VIADDSNRNPQEPEQIFFHVIGNDSKTVFMDWYPIGENKTLLDVITSKKNFSMT